MVWVAKFLHASVTLNFTLAKCDLHKGADLKRIFCPRDLSFLGLLGVFLDALIVLDSFN